MPTPQPIQGIHIPPMTVPISPQNISSQHIAQPSPQIPVQNAFPVNT